MTARRSPRVFIGLVEVAGFYSRLASGFRQVGVPCTVCFLTEHALRYESDYPETRLTRWTRWTGAKIAQARGAGRVLRAAVLRPIGFLVRVALFIRMATSHDVFVFGFGTTFFRGLDVRLLRALGKKVVIVFNGTDHRPPYLNGVLWGDDPSASLAGMAVEARRIKARVRRLERHANVIVGHHLAAQFHEAPFVPLMIVGLPCRVPEREPGRPHDASQPIRLVHAPSNPRVKGTDRIRVAVASLVSRGYAVEFIEIIGRPNAEVLDELRRCDFVVDELYSDCRMAGLASEAALFAKPSVVAGYASDELMRIPGCYEAADFPPALYCRPEDVEGAIESLMNDVELRGTLGEQARAFVDTEWRAELVADRILKLIDGTGTGYPYVAPQDLRYFHGFGLPEPQLRELLRSYVAAFGESALLLDDKPVLLGAIRTFLGDAVAAA